VNRDRGRPDDLGRSLGDAKKEQRRPEAAGHYVGSLAVTGSAPQSVVTDAAQADVLSSSFLTVSVPLEIDHLLRRNRRAFSTDLDASPETAVQSRLSSASAFSLAVGSAAISPGTSFVWSSSCV
jgi:hypothetical protein